MEIKTFYGRGVAVQIHEDGRIVLINLDTRMQAEVAPDWDVHFQLNMLPEYWEPPSVAPSEAQREGG